MTRLLKRLLFPNTPRPVRVLYGPFRGARLSLTPADSVRKILGLYEHELNAWLRRALNTVDDVVDVGANDGYFTFGCAAALKRRRKHGAVIAVDPQAACCEQLIRSRDRFALYGVEVHIEQAFVGARDEGRQTTLPSLFRKHGIFDRKTLIKIDVEGAELAVLKGAEPLIKAGNLFLVEVHCAADVAQIVELFSSHGSKLDHVKQRPLRLLGAEMRDAENSWLVSRL
jgi:hypothetical protein